MSDDTLIPGPRLDAVLKEVTYGLERRCVHCRSDRQAHREPEHRDPDRRRMPDSGEPGGTIEVEATLEIGVMATVPTHATRDETEQALYETLEDGRLDGMYIYDGPHADSPAKFEEWLDDNAPRTDGGPITDVDLVPVDEDVVEAGYPIGALNQAILSSQERFRIGLTGWAEGDNWTDANPRDLANDVGRDARGAVLALEDGDHAEARKKIGDALNYLLFLRDRISVREGGDSS
jgi:hypothetical protein